MDIKRIDINEFRELGYLQEVNRQFFHPLGLALEVIVDDETGEVSLGGIWDYRDDPEGILFVNGTIEKDKVTRVAEEYDKKSVVRVQRYGYIVQPAGL